MKNAIAAGIVGLALFADGAAAISFAGCSAAWAYSGR